MRDDDVVTSSSQNKQLPLEPTKRNLFKRHDRQASYSTSPHSNLIYPRQQATMIFRQALSILLLATCTTAFTTPSTQRRLTTKLFSTEKEVDLGLTPELEKVTKAFKTIGDEQTRYKQLLYMAQNTAEANNMPESCKIPENKVPGCLSTVFIDGTAEYSEEVGDYVINFIGDSDGLLTRGLVALLVR